MEIERDVKIIKQIGKGSFSNVFLCLEKESGTSNDRQGTSTFSDLGTGDGRSVVNEYFIIKEININELVKKYKKKNKHEKSNSCINRCCNYVFCCFC